MLARFSELKIVPVVEVERREDAVERINKEGVR